MANGGFQPPKKSFYSGGSFLGGTLKGDKELIKGLSQLPPNIQKRVMRNASRKAMTPISIGAKKSLQQDINFNREWDDITSWNDNPEARVAKLKVLRKSINTIVRSAPKYTKKGNMVTIVGKRYGDRFPADQDIPESLWGKYINPFARKWEYHGNSYLISTFHKERENVLRIMRKEVAKGIQREVKRSFREALRKF